jgi:hypothetical protein
MLNGTYQIQYTSPFGSGNGSAQFQSAGSGLRGTLNLFKQQIPLQNGVIKGKTFEFSGELTILASKLPYQVKGTFTDKRFEAKVFTKMGNASAVGTKVS